MAVHINLAGVLLGAIASMLIGALYYADKAYGKDWKTLAKINQKRFDAEAQRVMPFLFLIALVTAFVVAFVTALYQSYFHESWLESGLVVSLMLWLGISATTLTAHNVLDQRPSRLTFIALGNRLLSLIAMGLLIGWLHP